MKIDLRVNEHEGLYTSYMYGDYNLYLTVSRIEKGIHLITLCKGDSKVISFKEVKSATSKEIKDVLESYIHLFSLKESLYVRPIIKRSNLIQGFINNLYN